MKVGSLFSGAGQLDLAVEAAFGAQTIWNCESNPAAAKVLALRFPHVPNLGDVTKIEWDSVEPVDILIGGFPCQDLSCAGRRAGMAAGTRSGLWVYMADAIAALRPKWVVIENVRGLLSTKAHRTVGPDELWDGSGDVESAARNLGNDGPRPILRAAGAVLGDLADLRLDAEWTTISASTIGAPHRRERVFIVAYPAGGFGEGQPAGDGGERSVDASGVGTGDRDRAGDSASGVPVVGRGAGAVEGFDAVAEGVGRDEGRPEYEGVVGGSDVAVGGAEVGGVDLFPTPRATRGGSNTEMSYALGGRRSDVDRPQGEVLLPSPMAQQSGNTPENHLRKKPGRRQVTDLAIIAENDLFESGGLLPTPTSRDHKGRNQRDDESCLSGALLPTPAASDGDGGKTSRSGDRKDEPLLGNIGALLPTPIVADSRGGARHTTTAEASHSGTSLTDALRLLPTPSAQDGDRGKGPRSEEAIGRVREGDQRLDRQKGLPDLPRLLPTPAAADHDRRQDYARENRDGSGGDDLVTAAVKATKTEQWGKYAPAIERWEHVTRPAPPPTEPNTRGNPRLSPAFSEWMMGWPAGWVTDAGVGRNDQLRIIGNGVVPQQATAALVWLLQLINSTRKGQ